MFTKRHNIKTIITYLVSKGFTVNKIGYNTYKVNNRRYKKKELLQKANYIYYYK